MAVNFEYKSNPSIIGTFKNPRSGAASSVKVNALRNANVYAWEFDNQPRDFNWEGNEYGILILKLIESGKELANCTIDNNQLK